MPILAEQQTDQGKLEKYQSPVFRVLQAVTKCSL